MRKLRFYGAFAAALGDDDNAAYLRHYLLGNKRFFAAAAAENDRFFLLSVRVAAEFFFTAVFGDNHHTDVPCALYLRQNFFKLFLGAALRFAFRSDRLFGFFRKNMPLPAVRSRIPTVNNIYITAEPFLSVKNLSIIFIYCYNPFARNAELAYYVSNTTAFVAAAVKRYFSYVSVIVRVNIGA